MPLAVFSVFVILSSYLAVQTFARGHESELARLHRAMAADTTKAMSSAIESELSEALRTVIQAAMYEGGRRGEDKPQVEARARQYLNERIAAGWSYTNFDVRVPPSSENTLFFEWLPDGGLRAYGYLPGAVVHTTGVRAFGLELDAGVLPRYGRLQHLAQLAYEALRDAGDAEALESELNERFACEWFRFEIGYQNGSVTVTVTDVYGGTAIAGA